MRDGAGGQPGPQLQPRHSPQLQPLPRNFDDPAAPADMNFLPAIGQNAPVVLVLVYAAGRPWAIFPEYLYVSLENNRVVEAQVKAD